MLPFADKIAFLVFALVTLALGTRGFVRLYARVRRGRPDTDLRWNNLPRRVLYSVVTTLTQSRTFRKRPWVSFFHSLIFYGFVFYLLVNLIDAIDGYVPLSFQSLGIAGQIYVLLADLLSAGVLLGVIALVVRRFAMPSRHDFRFNERTLLHEDVRAKSITRDSIFVSAFILFHVGSRAVGAGAKLLIDGPDTFAPFATLVSHLLSPAHAEAWRVFGYWGALGSVLGFLSYFPYTKHIHIFAAPAKYLIARDVNSGTLPSMEIDEEAEEPRLGAERLEDLAWPRLVDAYACIQCNRCQDVCPATATGKSLSPSALEINKRMELNRLGHDDAAFEGGAPSPRPLLAFALSVEAAWGCTTCGACMEVCPVQDEPMLDIIDVRRQQVMMEGAFPTQLQSAFRGMERSKNPWGTNHEKRLDWAAGLGVKTIAENPEPDVLFWVGCAASYDPQSQKTARAFVQLMQHADVDFAVLGKQECCTGDSARRAGNEYLFRQLAEENVGTLNTVKPKRIVATCPHCMNALGKEYKQFGGDYEVQHHTEYLAGLVAAGKLEASASDGAVAFHDPCYLGRHNGVYDAPRNLLNVLSNDVVELPRNRENSFCCGAGGAQFWKEEEPGDERISDNRYREAQKKLSGEGNTLAVGCPFCKSMLESTPGKGDSTLAVRDVAELLLEGVQRKRGLLPNAPVHQEVATPSVAAVAVSSPADLLQVAQEVAPLQAATALPEVVLTTATPERKKWTPKAAASATAVPATTRPAEPASAPGRKKWAPKISAPATPTTASTTPFEVNSDSPAEPATPSTPAPDAAVPAIPERKKWAPKKV